MIKFNLLPWREELRIKKQKEFTITLITIVICSAVLFTGIHLYFDDQQIYQTQRNQMLQDETVLLDKQILDINNIKETKKHLSEKIKVINSLQRSLPETAHLFDEISHITPDGLFLTKLTRIDRKLIIEGKSESNALVSAFMRSMETSLWLQAPSLDIIQSQDKFTMEKTLDKKLHDFTLRITQRDLPETQ